MARRKGGDQKLQKSIIPNYGYFEGRYTLFFQHSYMYVNILHTRTYLLLVLELKYNFFFNGGTPFHDFQPLYEIFDIITKKKKRKILII